ncbi:MAG: hypothetical protein DGJ47_000865 [Rickettsiaceae bacterium]
MGKKQNNIAARVSQQVTKKTNKANAKQLKQLKQLTNKKENSDYNELYKTINKSTLSTIAKSINPKSIIENYSNPQERADIFDLIEKRFAAEKNYPEFKSEILTYNAEEAFNKNKEEKSADVKFSKDKEISEKLLQALGIKLNAMKSSIHRDNQVDKIELMLEGITSRHSARRNFELNEKAIISKHEILTGNSVSSSSTFETSVTSKDILSKDPAKTNSLLQSFKNAADIAQGVDGDDPMATEALNCANAAANIQFKIDNHEGAAQSLSQAAKLVEKFSNKQLSQSITKHIEFIDNPENTTIKITGGVEIPSTPITMLSKHDISLLQLHRTLQPELNKIAEQTTNGKWENIQPSTSITTDYGVGAELQRLINKNPKINSNDIKKVVFREMVNAVVNSEDKDVTCLAIFAQQNRDLIQEMADNTPDIFCNSYIFQCLVPDAHKYSKQLWNEEVTEQPKGHNLFLETSLFPVIAKKIGSNVLEPVENTIKEKSTAEHTNKNLSKLLNPNYFTTDGTTSTSYLGHNLGMLKQAPELVQIMQLVTALDAKRETKSDNWDPIKKAVALCPKPSERLVDHYDYMITNSQRGKVEEYLNDIPTSDDGLDLMSQSQILGA